MSKFIIYLWSGSGYGLDAFEVEATSEEHALDLVVTQIVNEGKTNYFEEEGSDYITELKNESYNDPEGDPEGWMYWDATMEGASRPVYLHTENMKIKRA